jgi:hypothetical protein
MGAGTVNRIAAKRRLKTALGKAPGKALGTVPEYVEHRRLRLKPRSVERIRWDCHSMLAKTIGY